MSKEEFQKLIDKYLAGSASEQEKDLMDNFFENQEKDQPAGNPDHGEDMWEAIQCRIGNENRQTKKVRRKARFVLSLMAGVIVVVVSVGFFYYSFSLKGSKDTMTWNTLEATYGKKTTFTLPDGSKVFLNSGSAISYPQKFDSDVREVILKGEAYFEVVRNIHQPFIVKSGGVTTKVLGTSFNIQAFAGQQICVTVASGKVQVEAVYAMEKEQAVSHSESVILNAKEQAIFMNEKLVKSEVDTARFLAWRRNILRFDDASLASVVAELERWYNIQITFTNEKILNCRINGQFKDQSLESVLNSIQYMYNIEYKHVNQNQIVLYGKGCLK